ncbi:hypothetical protein [Cellulomonas sp.]|uniref:hypothetical protein n=1 Tax=Cellulomonas sp. TaxID=40001 RepID=UPI0025893145|nr:hypothetical protein [Cellulomonas sp.]MCR6689568.1 hypothetical protein [Cellulomonas sp.]
MDARNPSEAPVSIPLLMGALIVAQRVAEHEKERTVREQMEVAIRDIKTDLRSVAAEFVVVGDLPELAVLADGWDADESVRLLVELRFGNPFFPFQFRVEGTRDESRVAALRAIARQSLGLETGTADAVNEAWANVLRGKRREDRSSTLKNPKTIAVGFGAAAATAGLAIVAAPALAVLMPAASGLSGAAAVSAGLAQLGFGSIASGGLGMLGGMWVLGAGGASIGAAGATLTTVLAHPGSAAAVGTEVLKLVTTFELALRKELTTDPDEVAKSFERLHDDVVRIEDLERTRNEKGSARLRELAELLETCNYAGKYMERR